MAKTTRSALAVNFPRCHGYCDHCGQGLSYEHGYVRRSRETAAGTFRFDFCRTCEGSIASKRKEQREKAYMRAMARHATRYSHGFGCFVAQWFGLPEPPSAAMV